MAARVPVGSYFSTAGFYARYKQERLGIGCIYNIKAKNVLRVGRAIPYFREKRRFQEVLQGVTLWLSQKTR